VKAGWNKSGEKVNRAEKKQAQQLCCFNCTIQYSSLLLILGRLLGPTTSNYYYGTGTIAHIQRVNDVTRARLGSTVADSRRRTLLHIQQGAVGGRQRHGRYLESMTSEQKIRLRHSIRIYSKNNPAIFHPDPIRNDEAKRPPQGHNLASYACAQMRRCYFLLTYLILTSLRTRSHRLTGNGRGSEECCFHWKMSWIMNYVVFSAVDFMLCSSFCTWYVT